MTDATTTAGRYELHFPIGKGGMATVHLGRLRGSGGFARTVAIKRLHPHYAGEPDFAGMLMDEARVAGRIRHPNVVSPFDVVSEGEELLLVMDYVAGESLSRLLAAARRSKMPVPPRIASAIVASVLHGLHAAHEARGDQGEPLGIVHRDVSPQNILVGSDGVARVLDFGIALAEGRLTTTRAGTVKGKLPYMAPEQVRAGEMDRRIDIYAAGVILWEALASRRLFEGDSDVQVMHKVLAGCSTPPRDFMPTIDPQLDAIAMRAVAPNPDDRFATAREMARALESVGVAAAAEIGDWVESLAGPLLARRAEQVADIESRTSVSMPAATRRDPSAPPSGAVVDTSPPLSVDVQPPASTVPVFDTVAAPQPPSRQGRALVAVLAATTIIATLLAYRFGARSASAPAATAPPEATSPITVVAPSTESPRATQSEPATAPAVTTTAAPAATSPIAIVRTSANTSLARPSPKAAAGSTRKLSDKSAREEAPATDGTAARAAGAAANDCDPPYSFDETGTKRYKRGCL